MRHSGHKILVVAHTATMASTLVSWLGDSRHELVLANSYAGAKFQLGDHPDVLITEVKLGEYNGLQLAVRGQVAGIPTIVLGPSSGGFEHEAERLGATYLSSDDLGCDELTCTIERVISDASRRQSVAPIWDDVFAGASPVLH